MADATASTLAEYVKAGGTQQPSEFIDSCWAEAVALVGTLMKGHEERVPKTVRDRAYIEVGAELVNRKQAPNGVRGFSDMNGGQPIRVARDPLVAARPLLAPYLPLGFA